MYFLFGKVITLTSPFAEFGLQRATHRVTTAFHRTTFHKNSGDVTKILNEIFSKGNSKGETINSVERQGKGRGNEEARDFHSVYFLGVNYNVLLFSLLCRFCFYCNIRFSFLVISSGR